MEVTIGIASYGEESWRRQARRAVASAEAQGVPVIAVHQPDGTLATARNEVLERIETDFLIYCDADDELEAGYVEQMAASSADLRVPRIRQLVRRRAGAPFMPRVYGHRHECTGECLRYGNWMVIGTCVRTELLREVGGWEEFGWSEDWAAWARCWRAGGTIEPRPDAIYRAHVSPGSRNRVSNEVGLHWHREIERAVWPDEPSVL